MSTVPTTVNDGNWNVASQDGAWEYDLPFADKGDFESFTATRKMQVNYANFIKPRSMQPTATVFGVAYLVNMTAPRDSGKGLLEWTETYARVPKSRSEYGSVTYTQQWLVRGADLSWSLFEYTDTHDARVFYEYSMNQPLPRILAPKVINNGFGIYYKIGGFGNFAAGQEILAQDTTSEIWLGRIHVRRSVLVRVQARVALN